MLGDKVWLITGGTGSFGQAATRYILDTQEPKAIRIFSRDELKQWEMEKRFSDNRLRFFLGDVRDRDRLCQAFYGVDIVLHAAALKQIPAIEYNPIEACNTNIQGAINVVAAAIGSGVDKVIGISSDKAASPSTLYGATKLVSERLLIQANSYASGRGTKFSCCRYGNVISSRGSLLPLLLEQKKSGKVTLTHPDMTRFLITLEQGVKFVIDCLAQMQGGEVFVPKIPSAKVTDIIDAVAPNCAREIIGIRPSEKMHEVLITEEESRHTKEFDNYYIIAPEHPFWTEKSIGGKPLPEGFRYNSQDNNLTKEDIKILLKEFINGN